MTEDEMAGWHHQLNRHEFEQALGDSKGQGDLVCFSSWGRKESGMFARPNNKGTLAHFPFKSTQTYSGSHSI